jgi:hypothetical protein
MYKIFDALNKYLPLLRWVMFVGLWIIVITACLQLKSWKEEYKTMGNVPVEEVIDVAAMIYIACMLYSRVNQEDEEKDKIKLIKRALREHDEEKA